MQQNSFFYIWGYKFNTTKTMKILLNNREEKIEKDKISITELMAFKNYTFTRIIVKVNGKYIDNKDYASTYVEDGFDVVILHMVAGGWYLC